ncbi:MAG: tetratricopeptide repeat protein, partial [Saprospiraceae bacterium]
MKNFIYTLSITILPFVMVAQSLEHKKAYNDAVIAYRGNSYEVAIGLLGDVVEESPEFHQATRLLAESYRKVQDEENMQRYYYQVLDRFPTDIDVLYNLSLSHIRTDHLDIAEKLLNDILEIRPSFNKANTKLDYIEGIRTAADSDYVAKPKKREDKTDDKVSATKVASGKVSAADRSKAKKYIDKGIGYYNEKEFQDAALAFDEAIKLNPSSKLYSHAGRANLHIKQTDKAIKYLRKAVSLDSDNGEFHYYLSKAYEVKGIDNLREKHAKMAASRGFESTEEIFNSIATKHYNNGVALHQSEQYVAAIKEYQRAIEQDAKNPKYHYNMAVAYYDLKEYKNAISNAGTALSLKPDYAEAYTIIGHSYLDRGDFADAAAHYEKAVLNDSKSVNAHIFAAQAYDKMKRYDDVIKHYKTVEKKDPQNLRVLFNIGLTYFKTREYGNSVIYFEKVIAVKPDQEDALLNLAAVLGRAGRFEEALKYAHQLIEIRPDNGEA